MQPAGWKLKKEYLPEGWLCLVSYCSPLLNFHFAHCRCFSYLLDLHTKIWSVLLVKVCGASEDQEVPSNFIKLPKDFYTPDAIAASDVLLGREY